MKPEDTRTPEQLAIALARNVAEIAQNIMEDNPHLARPRTFMHAKVIKAEADAFLNRVLPASKPAE